MSNALKIAAGMIGGGGLVGDSDPLFSSVFFLSNYATDESDVKGHTVSLIGGASVSGGRLNLDGSGDGCTVSMADVGYGDLTVEALVGLDGFIGSGTNGTSVETLIDTRNADYSAGGFIMYRIGGMLYLWTSNVNNNIIATTIPAHQPTDVIHIAVVIEDKGAFCDMAMYWGGIRLGLAPDQSKGGVAIKGGISLGYSPSGPTYTLDGKFYAARATSAARYTGASITTPSDPFPEA